MSIGTPVVSVFLLRLAPGVVATMGFRLVGSHVATRPLCAGRQSQVDEMWMVAVGAGEIGLWCFSWIGNIKNLVDEACHVRDVYKTVAVDIIVVNLCIGREYHEHKCDKGYQFFHHCKVFKTVVFFIELQR